MNLIENYIKCQEIMVDAIHSNTAEMYYNRIHKEGEENEEEN